jgi:cellulose synthase/poly-beta-1,6-N-acetylglucosamine synthase-like glycosyltransferase/peptidoglycan/xylan/chitin deacetylase (PgdA/CDA1 family)/spore germination protein YaaH
MSKYREVPIFFDPDRKRWPRLRRGVFLTGLIFSLLFGMLIVSILINPILPKLNLPKSSFLPNDARAPTGERVETEQQRRLRETKQRLELERSKRQQARHPRAPHDPSIDQLDVGFYVSWDETSMSSLKENIKNLDVLIGEFLHLESGDGELREESEDNPGGPGGEKAVTEFVRSTRPDLKIFALLNNFDGKVWESDKLAAMLASPEARTRCVQQLAEYSNGHDFAGVSIDFENVFDASQPGLLQFTNELSTALHAAGRELSINLPVNNDSFDYRKFSTPVDYVILMAYDQHYSGSDPGPVAGVDWFENVLKLRQSDVPASKTIVAIGNYAYDWKEGKEPDIRTFEEAVLTASESSDPAGPKIQITLDPASLNPKFEWVEEEDGQEKQHQVWMLDAVSAFNQVALTRSLGARGVALWRLGSEDPSLWNFFGADVPLDEGAASKLTRMTYGYGLDYESSAGPEASLVGPREPLGEMLRIAAKPKEGSREIKFDAARGLITAETVTEFPSPWVISRYGAARRKIALTFDDGPDPEYTLKILDELKKANAPATFFVIGLNGELHPDLLKREIAEGHEIGNHTFTHPNVATISETQFRLELKATQVLLESVLGRRTLLFRPPFAEDSEPDTPDQVRPLELATDLGYVTVGMLINPDDWRRPGVGEIVKSTVEKAQRGAGNVVLLHDSGGDRSQTIQALPILIAELRARGFELVTVGDLMGKSRDEVMPLVPANLWWQTWSGRAAFATVNFVISAVHYLFLIGIVLGAGRLIFIGTLAIIEHWRERHAVYDSTYSPTVAVIVPAFNEEKVILQTVVSLLASDHPPNFEIVVVDDGSTDGTYQRCLETFASEPRVRVFTKPNSGKPDALNYGVRHTASEIVIALDADTLFARDTISKLIRHFANPRVGAVAGNAKVGNRVNLLTRWQALEYVTSQNLDRRAFNLLNCVTVVPGAVGAWRRELIEQVAGFNDLTLAEDADLTMSIRKLGYSIAYEDEAVGLTEAPDTVRGFVRQRYRWMYGTLQAAWKHADALFRPRYGSLGFIALPNIFIFQVLFPLISPVMDLLMLVTLTTSAVNKLQHPQEFSADSLWRALFYYALFVAIEFAAASIAFLLEKKENKRLLVWLFWQRFFYRQLMYYVAIKATVASLKGIAVGWNKVERKATVKA